MKTRLFISLALPILFSSAAAAPAADLAPLVKATQRIARDPSSVTVVWWLPPAFIEGLMERARTPTPSVEHQALAALDNYALFALLHVSRDQSGTLVAASRDDVLMNARLEVQGKTLNALTPGQISPLATQYSPRHAGRPDPQHGPERSSAPAIRSDRRSEFRL